LNINYISMFTNHRYGPYRCAPAANPPKLGDRSFIPSLHGPFELRYHRDDSPSIQGTISDGVFKGGYNPYIGGRWTRGSIYNLLPTTLIPTWNQGTVIENQTGYYQYPYSYYRPESIYFSNRQIDLGANWIEHEGEWTGVWKRRGNSDIFDARWTHPVESPVTAVLTIKAAGNSVRIERKDTDGTTMCTYQGTISEDGVTVKGTYTCNTIPGQTRTWNATIQKVEPIPFDQRFLDIFRIKGIVYPDRNHIHIEGFLFGVNVVDETYTLQDRELVYERSEGGTKAKLVVGLKPSGKTIYARGEIKVGGRIVSRFGPTTIASW
jgi:hypothetical protein